jgi:hypothetical protein
MFGEPHLGQNLILLKALSCLLALSIDFLKPHFCFHRLPSSLYLNSLACSPHNGQGCPGWSCLSYTHLMFGQVHGDILTHHQKLNQSRTGAYYQPCLIVDGGVTSFLCFSCFLTPLNLLILTTPLSRATQYMLFRFRW